MLLNGRSALFLNNINIYRGKFASQETDVPLSVAFGSKGCNLCLIKACVPALNSGRLAALPNRDDTPAGCMQGWPVCAESNFLAHTSSPSVLGRT